MKRRILAYCSLFLLTVSPVLAGPFISAGTHYMLNSNVTRKIPITVSSFPAERIEAVYLAVQIGDGGSVNGGANATPRITNLDIIGPGTIFDASNLGCTPQYLGTPSLIALAETATAAGDLEANGVLAYLTVNPNGAPLGSYAIGLRNVGANVPDGPWNTELFMPTASISGGDSIQIVALHQSVWSAAGNGAWTDANWTNPQPPFPNYTTQAIVNTPYTVNVASAQEADTLTLSGGGKVSIGSTGSLAISNGVTVSGGGVLSLVSGAGLSATGIQLSGGVISGSGALGPFVTLSGGTLNAPLGNDNLTLSLAAGGTGGLNKTGAGTATILSSASYTGNTSISAGRLQFNGPTSALHVVSGAGALGVGNGTASSLLSADSINASSLTIAAGSMVTINPLAGGPLAASRSLAIVPEPSSIALLALAALGMFFYCRKI